MGVYNSNSQLNVVSLFSGCGGMDLGFEGGFLVHRDSVNETIHPDFISSLESNELVRLRNTRFKTVFANDILEDARKAWIRYFGQKENRDDTFHLGSIVDLVKQHRNGNHVFPDQVDVVTGGFPCQDFSLAGRRKGFESHKDHHGKLIAGDTPTVETRGQLYMWLKEVVEITKPKLFIAENVKGLVNLSNVKEIIRQDFSSMDENGYIVLEPKVLHAADYGVPQSRERVIFIGIRKSALLPRALEELSKPSVNHDWDPYPVPTHAYTLKAKKLKPAVQLMTLFKDLPEPADAADLSQHYYSRAKFMGRHCQGQTEVNLGGIGPTIRSEHHGNIEFRRLSVEHDGKNLTELNDLGLAERRLTPRECALIQTFPPEYEFITKGESGRFTVAPSAAYKLIGNAVPPLLAFHLATRIEKLWNSYFYNPDMP